MVTGKLEYKRLGLTEELWQAIDAVRGDKSYGAYIEAVVGQRPEIRRVADLPDRPHVGTYSRDGMYPDRDHGRP